MSITDKINGIFNHGDHDVKAENTANSVNGKVDDEVLKVIGSRPKNIPIIGDFTPRSQYKFGGTLVGAFLLAAGVAGFIGSRALNFDQERESVSTKVQMLSQRLAGAAQLSVQGDLLSINKMRTTRNEIIQQMDLLLVGDPKKNMGALDKEQVDELFHLDKNAKSLSDRIEKLILLSESLIKIESNTKQLEQSTSILFSRTDQLKNVLFSIGATDEQQAAADHMHVLSERIRRNGIDLLSSATVTPDSLPQILTDTKNFRVVVTRLLVGDVSTGMAAVNNQAAIDQLTAISSTLDKFQPVMTFLDKNAIKIIDARLGQRSLASLTDAVLRDATRLAEKMSNEANDDRNLQNLAALFLLGALLAIFLVIYINNRLTKITDWNTKKDAYDSDAKNKYNESQIIDFMGEVFPLEAGNLTMSFTDNVEALEGITGGIRSSVNEAVSALREAVSTVKGTATEVSSIVDASVSSTEEMEQSNLRQTQEISNVVAQVAQLTSAIGQVTEMTSRATQISTEVRQAAAEGGKVVGRNNEKMSEIRGGMQEVLKSVKHSGETSQEISSIVELIDGITDRTQIIAVNASLEAAKAGAAGAPFKVLAGEVNRLSEQSKELQLTIAALVQRNQGETAATIRLVEESTNAVVEGAQLSELANAELTKISAISEEIARFMDEIRSQSQSQSTNASGVSDSMDRLLNLSKEFQNSVTSVVTSVKKIDGSMSTLQETVSQFTTEK